MTKRDAVEIALKTLGVVWLIRGLSEAIKVIAFVISSDRTIIGSRATNVVVALSTIVAVAAALVLLGFTNSIARALIRRDSALPALGIAGSEPVLAETAIRVAGVLLIAQAVSTLIMTSMNAIAHRWPEMAATETPLRKDAMMLGIILQPVAQAAMGIYFAMGAKGLLRCMFRPMPEEPGSASDTDDA